jgi:two-component system sensor histidine kinase PilS (NtrC family)
VSSTASTIGGDRRLASGTSRELYFLHGFRVCEAVVYLLLAFSPWRLEWLTLRAPVLGHVLAPVYLLFALIMLYATPRWTRHLAQAVSLGLGADILAAILIGVALPTVRPGVTMMLIVNMGAGGLLLPLRVALFFAALATLGILARALAGTADAGSHLLEAALLGLAYFASTGLCHALARQIRASEALAEQRGLDLANLSQVNELIIRRMKTGVLMVDDANRVHQLNESAWMLLGSPPIEQRDLGTLAPELSRRLYHWRHFDKQDETAVALAEGVPEVTPRFTRLSANDDSNVLIFLDDTSLVSRRAEQLTLDSLGRLSASIAHEIRNPLAAIRYSAQLLAESTGMPAADAHMVEIINNHCGRMNEIVENILQLSRRERSRPETLDLNAWALRFIEEYRESNDIGHDSLRAIVQPKAVQALADPQHLQQVIWNLVQNALRYGRLPGEPARVMVIARRASEIGPPLLEVTDRGPGIPTKVAARIFEPFYTTHEYGTGLGLYLARQMCEANQAQLEYVPVAGGGSCFRITLAPQAHAPVAA